MLKYNITKDFSKIVIQHNNGCRLKFDMKKELVKISIDCPERPQVRYIKFSDLVTELLSE